MSTFEHDYWKHQWVSKGYVPGGIFVNGSICYNPIPKNASTYIGSLLLRNGWNVDNHLTSDMAEKTTIVLLRDPITRWVSGITQYLFSALVHRGATVSDIIKDWNLVRKWLILDNMVFDDHTEKQTYFLNGIDLDQCVFFDASDNPHTWIREFLVSQGQTLTLDVNPTQINFNTTVASPRQKLAEFFTQQLGQDGDFIKRIFEVYQDDFELIKSVKYYSTMTDKERFQLGKHN